MKESIATFGNGFLLACAAGAVLAVPVLRMLTALKSKQTVSEFAPETHQVKQGTPTMGGILCVLALVLSLLVVGEGPTPSWVGLWVLGFALVGFADDFVVPRLMPGKRGLGWKQKFGAQALLALLALPVLGWEWSAANAALAVLVVLFFCNAYNFSDGLDGLSGSLGVVLALGLGAIAALAGASGWVALCGALAGCLVPFLFLNAPPAKVFMGDVGSLPIGAAFGIAVCGLLLPHGAFEWEGWAVPGVALLSFVMIAELVPVPLQVLSVKLTGRRLFLMTPIHHAFEKRGWPETRVVFAFVLVQLVVAVAGVAISARLCP
ncbi:MAG: hypothetical protein M9921_12175 [Fimbriimonadaceae bacterium]|nr:hypothetical protein [Fimbriimonadaceae bacterium]